MIHFLDQERRASNARRMIVPAMVLRAMTACSALGGDCHSFSCDLSAGGATKRLRDSAHAECRRSSVRDVYHSKRDAGDHHQMPETEDIYRAARRMIENHGGRAALEAEKRANNLLAFGEADPAANWQRIAAAIRRMEGEASSRRSRASTNGG